jgi:hypothetical protein
MAKSKRGALVSQYLEGISRTALAEYQQFFREQARHRNGVCVLTPTQVRGETDRSPPGSRRVHQLTYC